MAAMAALMSHPHLLPTTCPRSSSRAAALDLAEPGIAAPSPRSHLGRHGMFLRRAARCTTQVQSRHPILQIQVSAARAASEPLFQEVKTRPVASPDFHHYSENLTVKDFMGTDIITAKVDTSIQEALELLVNNRITGLPVVDDDGKLIGVVSDYDLLAIDALPEAEDSSSTTGNLFPKPESSWKAFKEIRKLLAKTHGQAVGDVMTEHPITVKPDLSLDEAARLLLGAQFRRLPVVDSEGKLIGLLTRGNIVKAALDMRKEDAKSV